RFQSGELYSKDSIKIADTLKFKTRKGRIVYGGGGIVPDVFVPLEVEHGSESVAYLMQSNIVGHFVFEQLDKDRKVFSGVKYDNFLLNFDKNDKYFNAFRDYIIGTGLMINLTGQKAVVKRYLSAEYARQLYGESRYYEITLRNDVM